MKTKAKRMNTNRIIEYQQTKDRKIFEEIYDFYNNSLYYFCFSYVKSESLAEEIVQETFITVIDKIDTLRDPKAFHAWIYRVCYSKTMNYYRKEKKYLETEEYEEENYMFENQNHMTEELDKNDLLGNIQMSMNELDEKQQTVMMLYYFSEFKISEIANILEVPEGTVKTRLKRAKVELQSKLRKRDVTPENYLSASVFFKSFQDAIEKSSQTRNPETIFNNLNKLTNDKSRINKNLLNKVGIVSSILGLAIVAYNVVPSKGLMYSVSYNDNWTSDDVEISVKLNKDIDKSDIAIYQKDNEIDFSLNDENIVFIAKENSEYTVQVKSEVEKIKIDKIDKDAPLLTQADHLDNKMTLSIEDIGIGIDYTKSYALYKNEKLVINEDGTIDGTFEEDIDVYLYDQLDNYSQYKVEL